MLTLSTSPLSATDNTNDDVGNVQYCYFSTNRHYSKWMVDAQSILILHQLQQQPLFGNVLDLNDSIVANDWDGYYRQYFYLRDKREYIFM